MNDSQTLVPAFQYSITDPRFDPVRTGTRLGTHCAMLLAALYGMGAAGYFAWSIGDTLPPTLRDVPTLFQSVMTLYGNALPFGGLVAFFGFIPGVAIGKYSGWLIGKFFQRFVPRVLSTSRALQLGFWISALLLVVRIGIAALLFGVWSAEAAHFPWMIWYLPNVLAFGGLWWVVYRLNALRGTYGNPEIGARG
jgi:hypothetical protein